MKRFVVALLIVAVMVVLAVPVAMADGPKAKGAALNSLSLSDKLDKAVSENDVDAVKRLLSQGADVNRSPFAFPPLATAASHGRTELAKMLIAAGAKVNAIESLSGGTALFWAAFNGHAEAVKLLLEKGADPNLKTKDGTTPLLATALVKAPYRLSEADSIAIAELLLKKGGKVNEPNSMGVLPRGAAASHDFNELAELFKTHGGKCFATSSIVLDNCRD